MSCRIEDDEDWGEDYRDADNAIDDEDDATITCPYCRREIFEDAPQCPYCHQYISEEDAPPGRKPWWIILGVLLSLAAIWVWIASLP